MPSPESLPPNVPYRLTVYVARAERLCVETAVAGVASFASPWEPVPANAAEQARRARRSRTQRLKERPPLEVLGRQIVVLLGSLVGLPFMLSVVFGGPVHIPVLLVVRKWRGGAATVSGRALRNVSPRRLPTWRKKGDARRTWFVGASATGKGPLWLDTDARLMHTWVVGATGTGKTPSVLLPALRSDILAGGRQYSSTERGSRDPGRDRRVRA